MYTRIIEIYIKKRVGQALCTKKNKIRCARVVDVNKHLTLDNVILRRMIIKRILLEDK